MARSILEENFANFPPDMVSAVVSCAAIDADRVAQFLDRLNRAGPVKVYYLGNNNPHIAPAAY